MKNYQIILKNILVHLKDSEKNYLMNALDEELKRIRRNDIVLEGETIPRKLFYINRDVYDVSSETLRALDVIKSPIALESPLQSLNYLINNISSDKETVTAIRFLTKCFNAETGEADVIVEQIDKIFKSHDYEFLPAEILILLIEVNYGSPTSKGLKYFNKYRKFVVDLTIILNKFKRTPIQDVHLIYRKLLLIVYSEINKNSRKGNSDNLQLLNQLKIEIESVQY
jgi:hypothetical protein